MNSQEIVVGYPRCFRKKKQTRHSAKRPPSGNPSHDTIRYLSTPRSQNVYFSSLLSKNMLHRQYHHHSIPPKKMCEVGVMFRFFMPVHSCSPLKFPTSTLSLLPTWRIIPVSKWLGSPPFYKPWSLVLLHLEGVGTQPDPLGTYSTITMVINHFLHPLGWSTSSIQAALPGPRHAQLLQHLRLFSR